MLTSVYLVLAVIFGFMGMILESLALSIQRKKLSYKGAQYLWNLPIKPIYATGGLIMYLFIKAMTGTEWYITILVSVLAVTIWEYLGGWFCVSVLKERLWNYSDKNLHLHGHISLWSIKWWLILVTIFYFFIFQQFVSLEQYLYLKIKITRAEDVFFIASVTLIISLMTLYQRKVRLNMRNTKRRR